jgi:hypothetical protein
MTGDDVLDGGDGDDLLAGDQTSLSLSTPPLSDGTPRYQSSTDLTIAGNDTLIGGGGANLSWDTILSTPSTSQQLGLTLQITQAASRGITNGSATSYSHLPTSPGADEVRVNLLSNGVVVNSGRLVLNPLANQAPDAVNDAFTTRQSEPLDGSVRTNDTDPDGDTLTVDVASGTTANGAAWTVAANGQFHFAPTTTFTGTDTFTYTLRDRFGLTDTGTVTVDVVADTAAPLVACEQPSGWANAEVTVHCTASDQGVGLADASQASFTLITVMGLGNEGAFALNPPAVCDLANNCTDDPAFDVLVDRKAPVVTSANDGQTYPAGVAVIADVHCADGGSGLATGTCAGHGAALPNSTGPHSFDVTAVDIVGNTTTVTVRYTVAPPANGAPVANDDTLTVNQGGAAGQVNVLANDTDPNGDPLTAVVASGTTVNGGAWQVLANGTATYTPSATFAGPSDSFTYSVSDGKGGTATGRVVVTIVADTTAPTVMCTVPAGWQADNVTVPCAATDNGGAGLADPSQAAFGLTTTMAAGAEGIATVDAPAVCDVAGNCTDLPPAGVAIDRKVPSVSSANQGAVYTVGQAVTKDVQCADAGSGLTAGTCAGHGTPLDTATAGTKSFSIVATDNVGNTATATVTYTVNAAGPTVSIGDASVKEGNKGNVTLKFPVTLSAPAKANVTVQVAISAGTATAGSDYTQPKANLSVTIKKGQTSGSVSVTVVGDKVVEPNETINARIVTATGVTIGRGTAVGTIVNDDGVAAIRSVRRAR